MNIAFPFQISSRGRVQAPTHEEYVRQLIDQVLFTAQGERINRPDFGSGLMQMVFEPNSHELATANQFLIQSALQKWLGDLIQIEAIDVEIKEEILNIIIRYSILQTQEQRIEEFQISV